MKQRLVFLATWVGLSGLQSGLTENSAWVREASADYADSRDVTASKAKSQLKAIQKAFGKLDQAIKDPKKLTNTAFFKRRVIAIGRSLDRAAGRDPNWDLSKERAYLKDLSARWAVEQSKVNSAKMEADEPAVGDWDIGPFAGAPKIPIAEPTWCQGVEIPANDHFGGRYSHLATALDGDSLLRAAQHACRAPKFKKRQAWVRIWRQALANRTGASVKLIDDFYKLWMRAGGGHGDSRLRDDTCTAYGFKAANRSPKAESRGSRTAKTATRSRLGKGSTASATGQRAEPEMATSFKKATGIGLGCAENPVTAGRRNISINNLAWWIDRGIEPPSELVRAVYILASIGLDIGEEELARGAKWKADVLKTLGTYALVATDIARLDAEKFEKELAHLKLNEWGLVMARLTFSKAQHMGRIYKAAYSTMDKSIQELAFEVPLKAFANWSKLYAANKEGIDLARKVEDSFLSARTQDIRDCHEKAHGHLVSYLKSASKSVKTKAERKAMFDDPIANVLLESSMVCAAWEGMFGIAATLYNQGLGNTRSWRGPRFASYYAMLERYGDLKAADPSLPLEDNQVGFWVHKPSPSMAYTSYEQTFNKTGTMMGRSGTIKTATKTAHGTKLTFKTESWKETIWNCVETRQIDRIGSDGKIFYRQSCKAKGKKTVTSTVKPFTVPSAMASGLKRGQFVQANVEFKKGGNIGVPLVIFKSSKQRKTLGALGVFF